MTGLMVYTNYILCCYQQINLCFFRKHWKRALNGFQFHLVLVTVIQHPCCLSNNFIILEILSIIIWSLK